MEADYFWTVYDLDISEEERSRFHGIKVGFLLDEGFVLKNKPKTAFVLGKNSTGKYLTSDIAELGSVIIAGGDGSPLYGDDKSGRYNFTESIVAEYLVETMPNDDRLILIGNRIDWFNYKELPAPYVTVIDEPTEALQVLNKLLCSELVDRRMRFEDTWDEDQNPIRSIGAYNRLMKERGEKELPYILVVINNLEELIKKNREETEEVICRLADLGKTVGVCLVVCTRTVSVEVLTDWMKRSIPAKIVFRLKNEEESVAVLGISGAETLNGKGDMLFSSGKENSILHLQAALLGSDSMDEIIRFYTEKKLDWRASAVETKEKG